MSKLETTEESLWWGPGRVFMLQGKLNKDNDHDITDDDGDGLQTFEQFEEWQCPRLSEDIENLSLGQIDRREAGGAVGVAEEGEHRS